MMRRQAALVRQAVPSQIHERQLVFCVTLRFFSELALEFLKKCYADNRSNTHKLLVGQVGDLDGRTPLETAVKANFKKFVADVAIQTLLKEIWIKDIVDHRKYHYLPVSFRSIMVITSRRIQR